MYHSLLATILAVAFVSASHASAAVVTFYSDRASFESVLSSSIDIDFEGIVGDESFTTGASSIVIDGVNFSSSTQVFVSGKNGPFNGAPFDSALLVSGNIEAPITADLSSAGSGFTAVGGFFGDLTVPGTLTTMTLVGSSGILDSRTLTTAGMGAGSPSNFFGWTVSGDTIVSVTHDLQGGFLGLDDFVYGNATAVPEPSSLAILGIGVLGVLACRRHKQNQQ